MVGINTMTAAPGISFAIPSKYAGEFLDSRINSIGSKYRYLGMKMITLTPQIYYLFNSQPSSDIRLPENLNQGCLVVDVAPNSPAEKYSIFIPPFTKIYRNKLNNIRILKQHNLNIYLKLWKDDFKTKIRENFHSN